MAIAEKNQRKREILEAALTCFSESGIESTTIDHIRAKSGASVGSIYHHFSNKEGVATALYIGALEDHANQQFALLEQANSAEQCIKSLVYAYVDWVTANPELALFMQQARGYVLNGTHAEALISRNRERLGQLLPYLQRHHENGSLRLFPKELYNSLVLGATKDYCRIWLSGRAKTSPMEYREMLADAAWRTVAI
ncbi:TetR/AcrR family transcriptional regulator [Moraxellaceae bacterium AER2_44_116]|nr:TetR/AcrR family transcriptional regulator [Moraxellaceae bacterium]TQC95843.1 TetR/AcrR family transcriptional regulator [Moraxellaceae bacterium AER2_44_116]